MSDATLLEEEALSINTGGSIRRSDQMSFRGRIGRIDILLRCQS